MIKFFKSSTRIKMLDPIWTHQTLEIKVGYVRYLPKFSPFINACEFAGSCLKTAVKQKLTETFVQPELDNRELIRTETSHQRKIRIVSREVENSLHVLTAQQCYNFVNHIMQYIPACICGHDIFFWMLLQPNTGTNVHKNSACAAVVTIRL